MKKSGRKAILTILVITAAALIAAIVISAVLPDRDKRQVVVLSDWVGGERNVVAVGGKTPDGIPDEKIRVTARSSDGSVILFVRDGGETGPLYSVYNAKAGVLVPEVTPNTAASLCYDGSAAFTLDELGVLTFCDIRNNTRRTISEAASDCVLSPHGDHLLYVTRDEEPTLRLVKLQSGKEVSLGTRYRPVAVSDDAHLIYVTDTKTGGFCLINKDGLEKARFTSGLRKDSTVFFNSDLSESVFSDADYTYISTLGGGKKIVAPSGSSPLFTGGSVDLPCAGAKVCGVSSFDDYYTDNSRYFLFRRAGSVFETVTEGYADVKPINDGVCVLTAQGAVVIRRGKRVTDTVNTGYENPEIFVTEDGKKLYYGGPDGKYYLYSGGETKLAADNAVRFALNEDGSYVFMTADSRLWFAKKPGAENEIVFKAG